jgi:hypothetical protein
MVYKVEEIFQVVKKKIIIYIFDNKGKRKQVFYACE